MSFTGRALRSTVSADGTLNLSLDAVVLSDPIDDEVIVRVEAAPINPSDLVLMLGPADVAPCDPRLAAAWPSRCRRTG